MGLEVVAPMAVYAVLEFSWKIRKLQTSPVNSKGKYIQAQPERELGDLPEFTGGTLGRLGSQHTEGAQTQGAQTPHPKEEAFFAQPTPRTEAVVICL